MSDAKIDGDSLPASDFNDDHGRTEVNFETSPVTNAKQIVEGTLVTDGSFPRFKRGNIYDLFFEDESATSTNLFHRTARNYFFGTVGSNITYQSKVLFATKSIATVSVDYDAQIVNLGDEANDSSVDAAWTAITGSLSEDNVQLTLNPSGGAGDFHFAKDLKALTDPVVFFHIAPAGPGANKTFFITDGSTKVTVKNFGTTQPNVPLVMAFNVSAETVSLWSISTEDGTWVTQAQDVNISSITTWFLGVSWTSGGAGIGIVKYVRAFQSTTTGSLTFSFSADDALNFTTVVNGRAVTVGTAGNEPVFKIVSTGLGSDEYVLLFSVYARYE